MQGRGNAVKKMGDKGMSYGGYADMSAMDKMGEKCRNHKVDRFDGNGKVGKMKVDMPMPEMIKEIGHKTPMGKTGNPTMTAVMNREFGRSKKGNGKKG
jgi:hypothetical protein